MQPDQETAEATAENPFASLDPHTARCTHEVTQEVAHQQAQWGEMLDNEHSVQDWFFIIDRYKFRGMTPDKGNTNLTPEQKLHQLRSNFKEVAAICISAMKAMDRKLGYDGEPQPEESLEFDAANSGDGR